MRTLVALIVGSLPILAEDSDQVKRLQQAATAFSEIMEAPDKGIPLDLIERSRCIVIVPGLKKGAFVFGAQYGKGFLSCRTTTGEWSAPGSVRVEGGSFGFQVGGLASDVILLVMNERGADKLLSSQFTLGGQTEFAAGPIGRSATAQTDALMRAEILSWSRARGVFAGLSLQGGTLRQDVDDNEELYGKRLQNRAIVTEGVAAPQAAEPLLKLLRAYPYRKPA
jgi:lipid-binding SYLF domain-containing protein